MLYILIACHTPCWDCAHISLNIWELLFFPPIKFHQTFWIWLNAAVVTTGRALRELLNLWYHFWKLILLLLICFLGFCMCGFDGGKLFVQFSSTNLLCMKVLLPEVTWLDHFVVSCYTETRGSFKRWSTWRCKWKSSPCKNLGNIL